jgi:threonine dehydratase/serine racemase
MEPTYADVLRARERIGPHVRRTPIETNDVLDRQVGGRVFLKCENLQHGGAFKLRGALNAVLSLEDDDAKRGVATHSSGNHAQALARAAKLRGIEAHIVMPETAPAIKRRSVEEWGGRVVTCAPTLEARERTLAEVVRETGANVVHPYNDARVIAGQGTAALELLEDVPDLDLIMAPVGGGGLMSGTSLAVRGSGSRARLIGAEPERADDAARSLRKGRIVPSNDPQTIADGLRTSLGSLTFAILSRELETIVTATEAEILDATRFVLERVKIVIEPSSAVPVAALMAHRARGARVGVILTGGNLDLKVLVRSAD